MGPYPLLNLLPGDANAAGMLAAGSSHPASEPTRLLEVQPTARRSFRLPQTAWIAREGPMRIAHPAYRLVALAAAGVTVLAACGTSASKTMA